MILLELQLPPRFVQDMLCSSIGDDAVLLDGIAALLRVLWAKANLLSP
jgi:hypothetical protein